VNCILYLGAYCHDVAIVVEKRILFLFEERCLQMGAFISGPGAGHGAGHGAPGKP
jgi:hypothetical protein